jgi:S-adenosylmethionine-dependent methyltransferase
MSQNLVRAYYASFNEREWNRLIGAEGALEFAVTTHALTQYLPAQGRILDLGGGPGRYTLWLVQRGYHVVLADLSPELLAVAHTQLTASGLHDRVEALVETDARDLSRWGDQSFDSVLSLGPFYHLPDPTDRDHAAQELVRVLRPAGMAFVTVMPQYAFLRRTIAVRDEQHHLAQPEFMHQLMQHGAFFNDIPGRFTAGYGMQPAAIAPFFAQYGLTERALVACEGIAAGIEDAVAELAQGDPARYQIVLDLLMQTARDPSIHGMSGHLLYIGCKEAG